MASAIIRNLDSALKHRLTGAVILVLLAVLLLPELLTGNGRAGRERLGSADASGAPERSFDIDLTEAAKSPVAPPPSATEAQAELEPAPPPPVNLPVPEAQPLPAAPVAASPEPAAAEPVADAAPPESAPAPTVPSLTSYYVQLGVFVNRASADALASKLKARNFAVVVDQIERDKKVLHRVRVGPEADRAAANDLLKRLADAGHKGSVVK